MLERYKLENNRGRLRVIKLDKTAPTRPEAETTDVASPDAALEGMSVQDVPLTRHAPRALVDLLRQDADLDALVVDDPTSPSEPASTEANADQPQSDTPEATSPAFDMIEPPVVHEALPDVIEAEIIEETAGPAANPVEETPEPAPEPEVAEVTEPEHAAEPEPVEEPTSDPEPAPSAAAGAPVSEEAPQSPSEPQVSEEAASPALATLPLAELAEPAPLVLRHARPGWDALSAIPFKPGTNDPVQVQTRIAGEDHRILQVIDDLRTQLLRTLQNEAWSRIAITGPTTGCGASFTALNLALSASRIPDFRAILMDMDQRQPSIARSLYLKGTADMQGFLRGDIPMTEHLLKFSETLALGLNTERPQNPSEVLHSRRTGEVLDQMIDDLSPDLVLYDLPAMLEHDDVSAFLPQVDGVLLVADAKQTLGAQIEECERRLAGKTPLLGVILNRGRAASGTSQAA